MQRAEDVMTLYRVAKNYYVNNMTQDEIAKREHISRSQISRLLSRAREAGIVDITVKMPASVDRGDLERQLTSELSLGKVIVTPSGPSYDDTLSMLQTVAAEYLGSELGRFSRVGIGWGQTVYGISLQLGLQEVHDDLIFYPVVGNSGVDNPYLQADSICARFADKFQARSYFTSSLIITPRSHMTDIEKKRLDLLRIFWLKLDALVLGIGGELRSGGFFEEMPKDIFSEDVAADILGDLVCNFVTRQHKAVEVPDDYETVIIGLEQIKKTPEVICVAAGRSKADMIRYASGEGYIKTLITDSDTAMAILE